MQNKTNHNRKQNQHQRQMVLPEPQKAQIQNNRIGHDLFNRHTEPSDQSAQSVYAGIEQKRLVERKRIFYEIQERSYKSDDHSRDEVELNALIDTP